MFYFTGCVPYVIHRMLSIDNGFPHSDISGSKVARHLPEAYRRQATSFITFFESRHPPYALKFPIRKFKNHIQLLYKNSWTFFPYHSRVKRVTRFCPAKWNQLSFSFSLSAQSTINCANFFVHLRTRKDPLGSIVQGGIHLTKNFVLCFRFTRSLWASSHSLVAWSKRSGPEIKIPAWERGHLDQ